MALKVNVFLPEDVEGLKDSLIDFIVNVAIESHTTQEIQAIINYYEKLGEGKCGDITEGSRRGREA